MIMQGSKMNMPEPSSEVFDSPPAFTDADAHVLFPVPYIPPTPHGSPPEYSHAPLPAVIALPQMSPGFDQSFARGYHVAMAQSGLQMGDWLRFLDALNIAMAGSPPVRVLDIVGKVVGFVPNHWAQLAGTLVQAGAQVGSRVVTKSLADRVLRAANRDYFGPRRLAVRVCTTRALRRLLGAPGAAPDPSGMERAAQVAESVVGRLPILGRILSRVIDTNAEHRPEGNGQQSRVHRLMHEFGRYILPLSLDVPPAPRPEALLDQASAVVNRVNHAKAAQKDLRRANVRWQLELAEGRAGPAPVDGVLGAGLSDRKLAKAQRKARKAQRKALKAQRKPKKLARMQMKVRRMDREEGWSDDSVLWVVVINAAQDAQIDTRAIDNDQDVEVIDERLYQAEVQAELEKADDDDSSSVSSLSSDEVEGVGPSRRRVSRTRA